MINISFDYSSYEDLINVFGKKELEQKWNALFQEMNEFLEKNGLASDAFVDKLLLSNAITDFYADIKRLKDFAKIKNINSQKTTAYTAYWLLRRKPIQISNAQTKTDDLSTLKGLTTLNERFVLQYILNYLSVREVGAPVLERSNVGLQNFCGTMLYYLIYRLHDAQSLEMILMAFLAGQVYERTDKDLDKELHPYDHVSN